MNRGKEGGNGERLGGNGDRERRGGKGEWREMRREGIKRGEWR